LKKAIVVKYVIVQVLGVKLHDKGWKLVVDADLRERIVLLDTLDHSVDVGLEFLGRALPRQLDVKDLIKVPVVGKD